MRKITYRKITALMTAASLMAIGLLFFKMIPMQIFGEDIRFDASFHIVTTVFCLYVIWFYVDQNKSWRTPFFVFSMVIISIVSLQRLMVNAHSDIGLLGGLAISIGSIMWSQWAYFKDKLRF
jgi:membrane-associated phospholipid phosphatase